MCMDETVYAYSLCTYSVTALTSKRSSLPTCSKKFLCISMGMLQIGALSLGGRLAEALAIVLHYTWSTTSRGVLGGSRYPKYPDFKGPLSQYPNFIGAKSQYPKSCAACSCHEQYLTRNGHQSNIPIS